MLLADGFMIYLIIIIVSVILSYLLYKYLNNDLIDLNKLVKNDIEKFTNLSADMFSDETEYSTLETNTTDITNKKDTHIITKEMEDELKRLKMYMRK